MQFTSASIETALNAWRNNLDVYQRSCACNISFEERVHPLRLADLQLFADGVSSSEEFRRRLIDFFRETILSRPEYPVTFHDSNASAEMPVPSQEQKLIRIESIRQPLDTLGVSFEQIEQALDRSSAEDRQLLDWFCSEWSDRPDIKRNPVSFAAFKDEHLEEIESDNWASRLRDRLGLRHYDAISVPIPIALMEYTVRTVVCKARFDRIPSSFRIPTSLDSAPSFQFFPTPDKKLHGSPMRLSIINSEEDLSAEILHPKIGYVRKNLLKVARYTDIGETNPLHEIRNNHLYALQLDAERDNFGEEMAA